MWTRRVEAMNLELLGVQGICTPFQKHDIREIDTALGIARHCGSVQPHGFIRQMTSDLDEHGNSIRESNYYLQHPTSPSNSN
jgi:hypothetical protein